MPDELTPMPLPKRIMLWRREIDEIRSKTNEVLVQAKKLAAALEAAQREEHLKPLVMALPPEADEWMKKEEPDPRGASAKEQPRKGGKFTATRAESPSEE